MPEYWEKFYLPQDYEVNNEEVMKAFMSLLT
jgi:hypothetical protein